MSTLIPTGEAITFAAATAIIVGAIVAVVGAVLSSQMAKNTAAQAAKINEAHKTEVSDLRTENRTLRERVSELESQVRLLTRILTNSQAITPADATLIASVSHSDTRLTNAIQLTFSLEEMQTLVADMGWNWQNVAGTTLDTKALGLVEYATRRGQIGELIERVKALRPRLNL